MAVDPISQAEDDMTEQTRWGLSRSDRAIIRLVAGVKNLVVRLKALEDRVKALEGR